MSTRSYWWFSEFKLTSKGILVRKTGALLSGANITLGEIGKWLGYYAMVRSVAAWRRMLQPHTPRIWFAPDKPQPWYVIWATVSWAGFRFARSESEADVRFHFDDATWTSRSPRPSYLNGDCADISKSRVADAFARTFGYALSVDPQRHTGPAVEKGEINGAHDGRIVRCPCAPIPGKCYERLIGGEDDATAVDWRTSIVNGKPVAIVRKTKRGSHRFSIHNECVKFAAPFDVFSSEETALIEKFCAAMKLDYGALDILRDHDGRIYIVDVNKTDTGPAVDLTWRDRVLLTRALAEALALLTLPSPHSAFGLRHDRASP